MEAYYKTLEIPVGSSQKKVRAAYTRLTRQYHPSLNEDNWQKFVEINKAFETLFYEDIVRKDGTVLTNDRLFGRIPQTPDMFVIDKAKKEEFLQKMLKNKDKLPTETKEKVNQLLHRKETLERKRVKLITKLVQEEEEEEKEEESEKEPQDSMQRLLNKLLKQASSPEEEEKINQLLTDHNENERKRKELLKQIEDESEDEDENEEEETKLNKLDNLEKHCDKITDMCNSIKPELSKILELSNEIFKPKALPEINYETYVRDPNATGIDPRLTEINICELIEQTALPFLDVTDKDIEKCLNQKIFLAPHCIYNCSCDSFSYRMDKTFDAIKIATIVNEINNGTYDYNYPIVIWDDGEEGDPIYDTDGTGEYHIRAFYYCKKNIYMSVNRSG